MSVEEAIPIISDEAAELTAEEQAEELELERWEAEYRAKLARRSSVATKTPAIKFERPDLIEHNQVIAEAIQKRYKPSQPKTNNVNTDFMEKGACKGVDPDLFIFDQGHAISDEAKKMCGGCAVRAACLEYSLVTNNPLYIAGISRRERGRIKRGRRENTAA